MKKALIIANVLFASATVFCMQQRESDSSISYGSTPYYRPWPPSERENVHSERVNLLAESTERSPSMNSEQLNALVNSSVTPRFNDSTQDNYNLVVRYLINGLTQDNHDLVRTLTGDSSTYLTIDDLIQNRYDAERRSLDLSNQNLTFIPFGVRKIENLEELDLSNNTLTSLYIGEIFNSLPKNLKKLNISGNDLESLGALLSFPDLEELTLDGWSLKYVPDDRIESITNIHGVNEGRVDPEYLAKLVVNKKNNLYSGNKLMLQALGGVCTVRLKRLQSDVN